ncbi:DUF5676 family membrane protein [Oricola sp.]|uniref:DUF5676 family membrane protein n=1 Tax=Oricola sp. TaxID=1979950 RepID=UPI00320BE7D5|nr:hypothetical protein [Oricola sp.]
MADSRSSGPGYAIGVTRQGADIPRIPVLAFGMSLGLFLAITFVLCVGFDLIFPGMAMYETWLKLLPGFTWLSIPSFLLGLVGAFAYGWYVALIFGLLFNYFAARWSR